NISQISDAVRGDSWKISLGYDRLDRLIQARAPAFGGNGQYTFGYDTLDNIVSMRLKFGPPEVLAANGSGEMNLASCGS
ncbi:hypothetical protein, partial [Chromobacterium amazonense]|uniref:hypothetical protein n=1 Tax=Chromobacterium amazonense TaxID=1382803 RepID=UPI0031F6BD14